MKDCPKAVWNIPYVSVAFFPILKQNFIAYRSSKVSSCADCIFEIHQLWQSGFSRVCFNSCCSCSFEAEIIKTDQSSHKRYSNNILNFQESTTISNACTKKVWKHIECTTYVISVRLCASSSFCLLVHFFNVFPSSISRMVPNILQERPPSSLILRWDSYCWAWFQKVFLFVWDTLFWFFSLMSTCLMVFTSNIPKYLKFSFSPSDLILSWFGSSYSFFCYLSSVICLFLFLIISMVHFLCQIPFVYPDWIFLFFCI